VGEARREERPGTHADVDVKVRQRQAFQRLLQRDQRANLIDGAKGTASSEGFLVIVVSSWTRFDRTSMSLRVGTFKTCSARPTRSSNTFSSLSQVSVAFSFIPASRSSAAPLVRSCAFSPSATSASNILTPSCWALENAPRPASQI